MQRVTHIVPTVNGTWVVITDERSMILTNEPWLTSKLLYIIALYVHIYNLLVAQIACYGVDFKRLFICLFSRLRNDL